MTETPVAVPGRLPAAGPGQAPAGTPPQGSAGRPGPSPFAATRPGQRWDCYARLAADGPVVRTVLPNGEPAWLVLGYEQVRSALADPRLVKGGPPPLFGGQLAPDVHRGTMSDLLHMDPPDHTRLRALVGAAFTRRRVEAMAPRIAVIADGLLDDLAATSGPVDLIEAYAFPLPMTVICEFLGVPQEDGEAFRAWSTTIVAGSLAPPGRWKGAVTELLAYVRTLLTDKRAAPREDLLSALVLARDGEDRLTEDELTSMVFLLLVAGQETTVNLISNAVHTLLAHPAELARLGDRTRLDDVIEEVLRYEGPVQVATPRYAAERLQLGGVTIEPGDLVVPSVLAAGRDPGRPGADVFDPSREALPHVAFGHGIHHCLGASLARLECRIALDRLLDRCPGLELAADADLAWRPGFLMHGLDRLPVSVR